MLVYSANQFTSSSPSQMVQWKGHEEQDVRPWQAGTHMISVGLMTKKWNYH